MAIKNLWSLNVDELLVADELKQYFAKDHYEILFPLNAQMKDVDLVLFELKKNKATSIQVKGSRTYTLRKSEIRELGDGSSALFRIAKKSIFTSQNKVDYFVFVLHHFKDGELKKRIEVDHLVIPIDDLKGVCKKKILRKGGYYFFTIWLSSDGKKIRDFNNPKFHTISLSKYLNNWKLLR